MATWEANIKKKKLKFFVKEGAQQMLRPLFLESIGSLILNEFRYVRANSGFAPPIVPGRFSR